MGVFTAPRVVSAVPLPAPREGVRRCGGRGGWERRRRGRGKDAAAPLCLASAAPLEAAATAAGLAVGAGSMLMFTPMINRVWANKSADGLSVSTWALNVGGFAAGAIYPYTMGFPFAQYGDCLALTAQVR